MNAFVKLGFAALLPVFATVAAMTAEKIKAYSKLDKTVKQVIVGLIFGGLAVVGTEWGIPMNGAQVNCRDASVVIAGLLFSPLSGIIAGLIGGIERWIAVAWGVGTFTRLACTLSTIIAGIYSASLRKYLFNNKRPSWPIAFASGVVIEVFHITMVFVTNMATPDAAMAVVKACTVPMVTANGVSVLLAAVVAKLIDKEKFFSKDGKFKLSSIIQGWLLIVVVFAFIATTYFLTKLQVSIASSQTDSLLSTAITDVSHDIEEAADSNLLNLSETVAGELDNRSIEEIAELYDVSEINIVDSRGIIVESTTGKVIGFDMASGSQSSTFLCLLYDNNSYVQDYGPISYDSSISMKYAGIKLEEGFVQVGINAERFQREIAGIVKGIAKYRHVGQKGMILVLDKNNKIVSSPETYGHMVSFNANDFKFDGSTFLTKVNAIMYYAKCGSAEGYTIVSFLPESEALSMKDTALYVNTFLEILVLALVFGMVYQLLNKTVVSKIDAINNSLSKIISGNLNEVINVNSSTEEFTYLSDDINSTVSALKNYIAEAEARIDKELELAKSIQSSAVPNVFTKNEKYDIYALMDTAKEVGGDFYDFYQTDSNVLNFLIADVSGKGIPAAMFMMRAKTELRSLTEAGEPINMVFTKGNNSLCDGNSAGMFVTGWQGRLDLNSGHVQFVNAGHNPPLVYHNGRFEYLKSKTGFVLAGMEGIPYKLQEFDIEKGDIIFLYTDGVTEATNIDKELFGEERLINLINSRSYSNMEELCTVIKAAVDEFTGEADQFDDITMLSLRYGNTVTEQSMRIDEAVVDDVEKVTAFIDEQLQAIGCPMKETMQINVAVDEVFSNIVLHGYHGEKGPVTVVVEPGENTVSIRFEDSGVQYNPLEKEDPDTTLSAEDRAIGGLGIFLVKNTMTEVKYEYKKNQNVLTIVKDF